MNKQTWGSILALSLLLTGCNGTTEEEKVKAEKPTEETKKHDHNHTKLSETQKQIYAGYFKDEQVKSRKLSDWAGDWQSVYPYLLDGTLDEVFTYKAKKDNSMTAEAYKKYYKKGYKTSIKHIKIKGNQVTFTEKGKEATGTYKEDGYEILTYEKGNRGVRYIFKLVEKDSNLPTYIQFSDHSISPTASSHYHIYLGNNRANLLKEVTNWPTFYPSSMNGHTIAHEMIAH